MRLPFSRFLRQLRSGRKENPPLPPILLVVWITTIAFIGVLAGALYYSKADTEQRISEQVTTVAQMAAGRVAMTFDNTDRLLLAVIGDLRATGIDFTHRVAQIDRSAAQNLLARSTAWNPGVASLALIDANGRVLIDSRGSANAISVAAQPYFLQLTSEAQESPVISNAMSDPFSGVWGVTMGRRLVSADGRFEGALVAHLELNKNFARFSQSLTDSDKDLIALRHVDSGLLAEFPVAGDRLTEDPDLLKALQGGTFAGVAYSNSALDGITRLVAYRKILGYRLYVVYGKNVDELLVTWRYELLAVVIAALLGLGGSAIVTVSLRRQMALTAQLETVRSHLKDSNHALRSALAASELIAAKDQLTGLWNRRTFDYRLHEAVAHRQRHSGTFSLLLIDMDHFKNINDRYGHSTGDEALKRFADVLHERLRQNDVDARWGGEEFAVLADGADLERAFVLAEQIREAVENSDFAGIPKLTVSIGLAEYQSGENGEQLLNRADNALYEAKRTGRNRVAAAGGGRLPAEYFFTGPTTTAGLFGETVAS
jgi:diguanylate cyclase (GGDEF)-like protein